LIGLSIYCSYVTLSNEMFFNFNYH
jgi:hypothetical protein